MKYAILMLALAACSKKPVAVEAETRRGWIRPNIKCDVDDAHTQITCRTSPEGTAVPVSGPAVLDPRKTYFVRWKNQGVVVEEDRSMPDCEVGDCVVWTDLKTLGCGRCR